MNFNESIIYKLHEIVYTSDVLAETHLQAKLNISYADFLVLMLIHDYPQGTQNDLAQSLRIGKSALSLKLTKLEKSAFLKRSAKSSSKRENDLKLTKKGLQVVQEGGQILHSSSLAFFKTIGKDTPVLDDLLEKVLGDIRASLA
ncbi:MAG: MarR family transcriptional regulator [bacterium]